MTGPAEVEDPVDVDRVVGQVRTWLATAPRPGATGDRSAAAAADRLQVLLADPEGVPFATRFVDRVLRPDDVRVAADHLVAAVRDHRPPRFLGPWDRAALRLGATVAPHLPQLVIPLARARLRRLIAHLLVDADPRSLTTHLGGTGDAGAPVRRNVNLLGEAVLGEEEAARRMEGTLRLIARPDVDHVSVKLSAIASQLEPWDLDVARARVRDRLRRLYRAARDAQPTTFVNLDMEEHRDLELTCSAFLEVLAEPEFHGLSAGIALQAYLPDSVAAMERVTAAAQARRRAGGVPLRVRLVKGANLSVERVDAELHGWPQAPYATKAATDANYLRILDRSLTPAVADAVHLGVASHNLFDVAFAWELARRRGVGAAVSFEMLEGLAPTLADRVRGEVGGLLLYTPVVDPADLDVATAYLVRRLEEVAAPGNFLRSLADLDHDPTALTVEEAAFRTSLVDRHDVSDRPRRDQDRTRPAASVPDDAPFTNEPDTDPSVPANRAWVATHLATPPGPPVTPVVTDVARVDEAVATARAAAVRWREVGADERRRQLRRVADALADARGPLLAVMAHEAGKTVAEADPEVSEAIDFARWYADAAVALDGDPEVVFEPHRVVVVTPPWNFPVAIPLGGCLAALAAGAAAIVKPAPQTPRCLEVAVAAVHAAGVDPELLQLLRAGEDATGRRLITHDDVDAVVLTGAHATAHRFRTWRPDLRLHAETSGKNAAVITPSADLDLAIADLVRSAFGHAGQKCSAASLAILVGDVDARGRVRRQLADATRSLRVGPATDAASRVGPLIAAPTGDLDRALTRLDPGERWLVEPRPLDAERRLWQPGIRDGVRPGSWFHHTECFGPVLGLIDVPDLATAIEVQNAVAYGLTGGIHSLDADEIGTWLDRVEVGNAYVDRTTTGAIVRRQPFGGWKRSTVGPGAKAGGRHYVAQFGTWRDRDAAPAAAPAGAGAPRTVVTGPAARLVASLRPHLDAGDLAWLERAAASDQRAWDATFAHAVDDTGLRAEANVARYRPRPWLGLHLASDGSLVAGLRVLLAAVRVRTRVRWSQDPTVRLPGPVAAIVRSVVDGVVAAGPPEACVADLVAHAGVDARLRVVGCVPPSVWRAAADHDVDVLADPVTVAGGRELLGVLREQAISRTMHRYGIPVAGPVIPPPRPRGRRR